MIAIRHKTNNNNKKIWEYEYVNYSSFGWNADADAKKIGINDIKISSTVAIPIIPPWLFQMPMVDLQLHFEINEKERCMPKEIVVDQYLKQNYFHSIQIYTDGSKKIQILVIQQQPYTVYTLF